MHFLEKVYVICHNSNMKKILNLELMNKYIEKFNLNDMFHSFSQVKKELIQFEKGEFLLMSGEELSNFLLCVDGRIEIYNLSKTGENFTIAYCDSFSFLGDMEFLSDTVTPNNVQALNTVTCISIPIDYNRNLLENDITLYKFLGKNVVKTSSIAINDRIKYQNTPAIDRLKQYLRLVAKDGLIDMNLNEIAKILKISYRQLMRHLNTLCEEGYISKGEKRGTYKLVQNKTLEI